MELIILVKKCFTSTNTQLLFLLCFPFCFSCFISTEEFLRKYFFCTKKSNLFSLEHGGHELTNIYRKLSLIQTAKTHKNKIGSTLAYLHLHKIRTSQYPLCLPSSRAGMPVIFINQNIICFLKTTPPP